MRLIGLEVFVHNILPSFYSPELHIHWLQASGLRHVEVKGGEDHLKAPNEDFPLQSSDWVQHREVQPLQRSCHLS